MYPALNGESGGTKVTPAVTLKKTNALKVYMFNTPVQHSPYGYALMEFGFWIINC